MFVFERYGGKGRANKGAQAATQAISEGAATPAVATVAIAAVASRRAMQVAHVIGPASAPGTFVCAITAIAKVDIETAFLSISDGVDKVNDMYELASLHALFVGVILSLLYFERN